MKGLKEFNRRRMKMPALIQKRVAEALEQNADELVEVARRDAPVKTGNLRDSIGKRPIEGTDKLIWRVFAGKRGPGLYDQGYYAALVEFGTKLWPAQPFFFVNYRAFKPKFKARQSRAIRKAIKESKT
jgi:HK97 gp10 family phage protein